MPFLVTREFDKDPIKKEGAVLLTTSFPNISLREVLVAMEVRTLIGYTLKPYAALPSSQ